MGNRGWHAALVAMAVGMIAAGVASVSNAAEVPTGDEQAPAIASPHKGGSVDLSDSALRAAVRAAPGDLPSDLQRVAGGGIVVEVVFRDGNAADARAAINDAGGDPGITVPGELVQAEVPVNGLEELEADPAVRYVRPPVDYSEPADEGADDVKLEALSPSRVGLPGQQIQKTNAAAWHAQGLTGQGVKVGIIDSFAAPQYNAAINAHEIPRASGTFCRFEGQNCASQMFAGDKHGVAVAEAVSDMAPSAQIYLATAITAADTQAALNYFASQGVKIVTRSQTGRYDGPGNGTGPIASVIENSAVGKGMFYLNAAGNNAGRNDRPGTYWRGGWVNNLNSANNFIEFAPGDELMGFTCAYLNGLRWSDFGKGAGTTDYDLYIYDDPTTPDLLAKSESSQGSTGGSAPPIERIDQYPCPDNGVAFMAIHLDPNGSAPTGDTLEIMTNGAAIEHAQDPFSASGPMADLKSPGAVAVGAVDPALGTTIADYSSQGPTNDLRVKPDLSAAACVRSRSYAPECFNGTSSATPVTAGAAALILGAGAARTPAAIKNFLLKSTVDRGASGTDNVYGRGELRLPSPAPYVDRIPPNVQALDSKGKSGKTANLRYRVTDNSGLSSETLTVIRKGKIITKITTVLGDSTGGPYVVRWDVPKSVKGKMDFCVISADPRGNSSPPSCAKLTIKKKKKHRKHKH